MVFEKNSSLRALRSKRFQKTLILTLGAISRYCTFYKKKYYCAAFLLCIHAETFITINCLIFWLCDFKRFFEHLLWRKKEIWILFLQTRIKNFIFLEINVSKFKIMLQIVILISKLDFYYIFNRLESRQFIFR